MFPTAEAFQQLRVTNRFHVHFGLKLNGEVCVQSANKSLCQCKLTKKPIGRWISSGFFKDMFILALRNYIWITVSGFLHVDIKLNSYAQGSHSGLFMLGPS